MLTLDDGLLYDDKKQKLITKINKYQTALNTLLNQMNLSVENVIYNLESNYEIIGRNLISYSKGDTLVGWRNWGSTFTRLFDYDGHTWIRVNKSNNNQAGIHTPTFDIKANQKYTASFLIRSYSNSGWDIDYLYLRRGVDDLSTVKSLPSVSMRDEKFEGDLAGSGLRVWFTFSHDEDIADARLMIALRGSTDDAGFIIREVKIEPGSKPTLWSSAPEENMGESLVFLKSTKKDFESTVNQMQIKIDELLNENRIEVINKYIDELNWKRSEINAIYKRFIADNYLMDYLTIKKDLMNAKTNFDNYKDSLNEVELNTTIKISEFGLIPLQNYDDPMTPDMERKTMHIPGMPGSWDFGMEIKEKPFNFPLGIIDMDKRELQRKLNAFVAFLFDPFGQPREIKIVRDYEPDKFYTVKIATQITPDRLINAKRFNLPFVASDPYKYSNIFSDEVLWGSRTVTFEYHFLLGRGGMDGMVSINGPQMLSIPVEGMSVQPVIEINGTAKNLEISSNGYSIKLPNFKNRKIEIDFEDYLVFRDGEETMFEIQDFFLLPGENKMQINGSLIDLDMRIKYRDKYT